jgi:molybdopterin synthase sulfurtransferase
MTLSAIPTITTISTAELLRRLDDPASILIDVRPVAAYNGWPSSDDARGGHLPGATPLPVEWLDLVGEGDLAELLEAKGVGPEKTAVLYGAAPERIQALVSELNRLGGQTLLYNDWAEWVADIDLPLERLPHYQKLVYPEWVRQLLDGGRPDTFDGDRHLVFHVNFGVPEEYEDGHIPGALYLDTNWLESSEDWNRRSPEELESVLLGLGVSADTTVVLYGRDTVGNPNEKWPGRRAGQIAATRAAAILRYAGVEDVRLLDGGYDHWVRSGHVLETEQRAPTPIVEFGASIPRRPELIIDIEDAKSILADPAGAALVSVRTWKEHIGQVSGYNYIEPKGRISGDVWGNCGTDAYHMQHYRNIDNTMRAYPEIAANWSDAGITPDKWVAFYCGTGWRASETWFYAYVMGWDRIAVYDGGWFEWSQDPISNPIEVGEPEDEAAA